jgi:hypothetical protein
MIKREAITKLNHFKQTHVDWAKHLEAGHCESCTPEVIINVGNAEHHRRRIAEYDAIIDLLNRMILDPTIPRSKPPKTHP